MLRCSFGKYKIRVENAIPVFEPEYGKPFDKSYWLVYLVMCERNTFASTVKYLHTKFQNPNLNT